jgi:uncharacterized protein YndB with AHSA1/START domain
MKVQATPAQPLTDAAVKAATGRTFAAWFSLIDDSGGASLGRKGINDLLFKTHKVDAWWTSTLAAEYERDRGLREKDGRPRGYAICVTKNIKAPASKVSDAFTTSSVLTQWLGAGARAEGKEGGAWFDGDGHQGTYTKIAAGKAVRFSWLDTATQNESLGDLKITEKGGVSSLVLNHERIQDRGEADGLRAGWGLALTSLKELLER